MKWSTEKPKKERYYWAYGEKIDENPVLVKIDKEADVAMGFNDELYLIENFSHFMGPLEIPEVPE